MQKVFKIVLATGIFPPDIGGPATHVRELSERLSKLGHQIVIVTYSDVVDESIKYQVLGIKRVSRVLPSFVRWAVYFWYVLRAAWKADVVYAFDVTAAGLPAFVAAKMLRKKFVVRIGGDPIWERAAERGETSLSMNEYYAQRLHKQEKPLLFRMVGWVVRGADVVILYNDFMRDFYVREYGVNPMRVKIVGNPMADEGGGEREEGRESSEPIFLFAGRFVKYKNLPMVMHAFDAVRRRMNRGRLVLIGAGPEREVLDAVARSLPSAAYIELRSALPHDALMEEIQQASVCLAPALTEYNPNFILECLSFGKPILINRENGLSVKLTDDFFFNVRSQHELEQKFEQFLTDTEYKRLSDMVATIEYHQTWESVTEQTEDILRKL